MAKSIRPVLVAGLLLSLVACQEEVKGPSPTLPEVAASTPLDPAIVCRDQLSTDVTVYGEGFSPVTIDIPNSPKVALPSITLSHTASLDGEPASEPQQVLFSGSPDDKTNIRWLTWQSQEQMTFTVNQQLQVPGDDTDNMLGVGIHDILVQNPNENEATTAGVLAVVDKPELNAPNPSITCLAQGARDLTLTGTTFLDLNGDLVDLEVRGVNAPFTPRGLSDCIDIAHEGIEARACQTAELRLAQDSIEPGYHRMNVHNPETAACQSEEDVLLRVVEPPVIKRVVPPLACVAEEDRTFTIEGFGFLEIDGELPALTVGGEAFDVTETADCVTLETMGHEVRRCKALTFVVERDALPPGQPEIVVTNPDPAGCEASNAVALTIVAPPTIEDVVPEVICVDDADRRVDIVGSDFLEVAGEPPTVRIGSDTMAPENVLARGCETIAVDGLHVRRCDTLRVTIPQGGLEPSVADVSVTNPDPAGCSDTAADVLAVVASPEVTAAEPPLLCTDDDARQLVVSGRGFLKFGATLPAVSVGGNDVTVDSADGCSDLGLAAGGVERCDTLNVTLPQGSLSEGRNEIRVENPQPAGCSGAASVVTAPPTVTLASAVPSNLCTASGARDVRFEGTGFLRVDGVDFQVFVDGAAVTPQNIGGCTALDVAGGLAVESCSEFELNIDPTSMPEGDVEIFVSNPAPASCEVSASNVFRLVGPPTLSAVVPNNVCSDTSTTLVLTGTGFVEGSSVVIGGVAADSVQFISDTELAATFGAGFAAGTYDVTVNNDAAGTCATTMASALVVDPTPLVFFVDPPVLYSGIQVGATIFTSGLTDTAASVELVDQGGNATPVASFDSPLRPNRIQAEVQAGLAAGEYEVRVTSQLGCVGGLPGAVNVSDLLTLDLLGVDPSYVSTNQDTAVTLSAVSPPESGQVGFESTPRVYLDPTDDTSAAAALRAVTYDSEGQLTAVVPKGQAPGSYNVIVVNPSGAVGVLDGGVTVTATDPPLISAVVPSSLDNNANQAARIVGQNFDTGGVTVTLECRAPGTTTTSILAGTVSAVTTTEVTATLPSAGLVADTVCVVQVTNTDGAFYRYAAISAKAPSQNLGAWSSGSALSEGRRALSAVAARPTDTSRFVYAIGGDDGTLATAKTSVEAASIDVFGDMGAFEAQRNALPAARTFASAATVGRFVYLTGGHDGNAASNTVLRAHVLDPLAGPEIVDLDAQLVESEALAVGQWFYRVSAVFPSTDASNPSGESLPGEPFTVQLPDTDGGIALTLKWSQVAGASGYRVYRSASADASVDDLEFLGEMNCPADAACDCGSGVTCEFTDDGVATDPTTTPLPQGSLGEWHAVAQVMTSAREGHKTVAIADPAAAGAFYLYAFGGRDGNGALLDSYEWTRVSVAADGAQSVSAWTASVDSIGVAKADLGVWVVSNDDSSQVPAGQVQIFVGTGATGPATTTGEIVSGWLDASNTTGELQTVGAGSLDAENSAQQVTGAAFGDAGGFLFIFGGTRNTLAASDNSTEVVAGPNLDNWNSLGGGSLVTRRAYAAGVQESAFFFVLGGATTGSNAITSVERTVQ